MNYPTEIEDEATGQRQRTEDHGKVTFASVFFFFAVIHPTFKHALQKESTIKRSVDDLGLFDGQRQDHLIFVITVEWIHRAKAMTLAAKEECFTSEI